MIQEEIEERKIELDELKAELSIIENYLLDKKKITTKLFKELMVQKSEIQKHITEVQLEIELLYAEQKNEVSINQQTNNQ